MFDIVKRLLGQDNGSTKAASAPAGTDRILTAACALLLEMAAIDGEFSAEEQQVVLAVMQQDLTRQTRLGEQLEDDVLRVVRAREQDFIQPAVALVLVEVPGQLLGIEQPRPFGSLYEQILHTIIRSIKRNLPFIIGRRAPSADRRAWA